MNLSIRLTSHTDRKPLLPNAIQPLYNSPLTDEITFLDASTYLFISWTY